MHLVTKPWHPSKGPELLGSAVGLLDDHAFLEGKGISYGSARFPGRALSNASKLVCALVESTP